METLKKRKSFLDPRIETLYIRLILSVWKTVNFTDDIGGGK
nr:hypothetical protein [uncultured Desulfobacter sp.]